MVVLKVSNLSKNFGKIKAVDNVSFSVEKGEIVGFLGPNGAGKSTTIQCLMNFLRYNGGDIEIFGKSTSAHIETQKNEIGYLAGDVNINPLWTGKDHISLIQKMRKRKGSADHLIDIFSLDVTKKAKDLSTGNKQKLGIVLALLHNPKLIILDEPTTGLDPVLQDVFYEELRTRVRAGATVFMSSHNLLEVENMCDRIVVINKGKIIAEETIKSIRERKLYSVYVYFKSKVPTKELQSAGFEIVREIENGVELSVKGDIKEMLTKLQKIHFFDIQIMHSTLEKVFKEFYMNK